ncbi:MAG: prolyl oligopeptidase family serine peptidase [Planctomycetota bacterium]|nr:prolyl oligopeptidase family serine peptidase [Planctomycetota bacterium]
MRTAQITALLLISATALPAQDGMTPQQLMALRQVSHVEPSSDGSWLAYTVVVTRGPDEAPGGARIEAFVMPIDGGDPIPVPGSNGLSWRPESMTVTYVAKREGDAHAQVYGFDVEDLAEARLTATPNGIAKFAWAPDGKGLAYTSADPLPELRASNEARGFSAIVVDESFHNHSLWHWDGDRARRLTTDGHVQAFRWAPTGTHLAVGVSPRNLVDDSYMATRLYAVDVRSARTDLLVDNPGKLGGGCWSPDGSRFAYISAADRNDPHAGMLYVVARGGGEPQALTPDFAGMINHVEWRNAGALTVGYDVGVRSFVAGLSLDQPELPNGTARSVPATKHFHFLGDDSDRIAFVGSTDQHPGEVFVEIEEGRYRRMTVTNPWLDDVALGQQSATTIRASDGADVEGVLILPVGHEDGQRHPLVIVAHGGPESHYSDGWVTRYSEPGQVLAARGYVVWYPNYRSSTGYGVAFAKNDHGDLMGREFEDHIDAIAAFDERGLIDRGRVGIVGGSYGGYTAAWAATRESEHFAAAVSFVPFVDVQTKWLTSDIPTEFLLVHYQERAPHEQRGYLADRSPLTWAPQCRTPLLLCGGTADPRVHPSQPFMLYRAVRYATETPVRYVQYPGEGHGNRSNVHQYDYLLRTLRWFDHYLASGDSRAAPLPPMDLDYPRW